MGLVAAGHLAFVERYIGYLEPYATSHDALDKETATQEDVRNVARAVIQSVRQLRNGGLKQPDRGLREPRPK
jgi:hypothetical protein